MANGSREKELIAGHQKTTYGQWIQREGLPVVHGYGVEDVRQLEMAHWSRLGGKSGFIHLYGMEGFTGMYVAEIPPERALEPEHHLYEEVICILQGNGATEIWQEGEPNGFSNGAREVFFPHRSIAGTGCSMAGGNPCYSWQ